MRADLRGIAGKLALGAALASTAYSAFALTRLRAFERRMRERAPAAVRPPVTVLKPVCGLEPRLDENLRSFCAQDYPDYHVVLGVPRGDDSALDIVRRVAAAFADRTTVVVGDGTARFRNPKMANLVPMLAHARGDILVIADSDMRVTPDYLDAVAAPFADPGVGAVTAIYRGEPADGGLASVLGAMCLTEQFAVSTLVANAVEPLTYTFGATIAVRRTVWDAIGGVAALGDELADDFALGRLVTALGHRIAPADYAVTNVVSERSLRALFAHELRWARTIRSVRARQYPGISLTYPLPLAVLHLALARDKRPALALVAATALLRLAIHRRAHAVVGTRERPTPLLIPLRDAFGVAVWTAGLTGRTVRWRDAELSVDAHGAIADEPDGTATA